MPLIVEDGTGVLNADSYVSVADAKAYALSRAANFPTGDAEIQILLIQAMDYLEALRPVQGSKTYFTQSLQWPRSGVRIDCIDFPFDAIPAVLKKAQMQLAIDAHLLGDLQPTTDGFAVAREKVDVIEIEYATGGRLSNSTSPSQPVLLKAQQWIDMFLYPCGKPAFLTTVRV